MKSWLHLLFLIILKSSLMCFSETLEEKIYISDEVSIESDSYELPGAHEDYSYHDKNLIVPKRAEEDGFILGFNRFGPVVCPGQDSVCPERSILRERLLISMNESVRNKRQDDVPEEDEAPKKKKVKKIVKKKKKKKPVENTEGADDIENVEPEAEAPKKKVKKVKKIKKVKKVDQPEAASGDDDDPIADDAAGADDEIDSSLKDSGIGDYGDYNAGVEEQTTKKPLPAAPIKSRGTGNKGKKRGKKGKKKKKKKTGVKRNYTKKAEKIEEQEEVTETELKFGFKPVKKDINSPKLLTFIQDDIDTYPPWMYDGYNAPENWWKIPPYYFGKHFNSNKKQFTVASNTSVHHGKSFMEFGEDINIECISLYPSPIDIITDLAETATAFNEFSFTNFDKSYAFTMFIPEDGTDMLFVKLKVPPKQISQKPGVDKGSLPAYGLTLDRIMIHFGSHPNEGSEHLINGKAFGMEIQLIFNLQKPNAEWIYYKTLYEYMKTLYASNNVGKDMLIISALVEVADEDEHIPDAKLNVGMEVLANAAQMFWRVNNQELYRAYQSIDKVFSLSDLLSDISKSIYYTYDGSITHPPCFQRVRWSIFKKTIKIPFETWRKFLFIPSEFSNTGFMAGNFRPLSSIYVNRTNALTKEKTVIPYLKVKEEYAKKVMKSKAFTSTEREEEYDYYEYHDY